jgi:putative DNA methylase
MTHTDKRLIEDYIPIKAISAEASREKSIRHGHISTLHLWWARRPLVASRAAVFAALVPAGKTADEKRELNDLMIRLCKWEVDQRTLEEARERIRAAYPDAPPKVLDMFAGGGAIPLEALRLGCEAYALDLNPVAHIIELATLVYPQKYGKKLAEDVRKWGEWVLERVRAEVGDLYPLIPDPDFTPEKAEARASLASQPRLFAPTEGEQMSFDDAEWDEDGEDAPDNTTADVPFGYLQPVAYLWTRTVTCPNPACRATVPLVRQTWLKKKKGDNVALEMTPHPTENRMAFHVRHERDPKDFGFDPAGFSQRGNSVCGRCGTTVTSDFVKTEGKAGRMNAQMMATVCVRAGTPGKVYLSPDDLPLPMPDEDAIQARIEALTAETGITVPDEEIFSGDSRAFFTHLYGLERFDDLYLPRQMLAQIAFCKAVREFWNEHGQEFDSTEYAIAVATYLGLAISKLSEFNSTLCVFNYTGGRGVVHVFGLSVLPMVWDFAETNPLNRQAASWSTVINSMMKSIQQLPHYNPALVLRGSATSLPYQTQELDAVVSDPPYYDNIPYADLADYFYVWLKRAIGFLYPEHLSAHLTPKKLEVVATPARHDHNDEKAREVYEQMMFEAMNECNRVLKPHAPLLLVYAHKTTAGWSTLIDALRKAGFLITEAWPLDTERSGRLRGQGSAALASSFFLVARKRDNGHTARYIDDILPEMKRIVAERVRFFLQVGVTGADLSIATVGAALAPYTRYARVELPNGQELTAAAYLDEVQREVVRVVLGEASKADERTQYYLMARENYGEVWVEFDEANNLARALGVELDTGPEALTRGADALVEKKGSKVRLRTFEERGELAHLGLPTPERPKAPLIDVLHRLLWLVEHDNSAIQEFLGLALPDKYLLRVVAQSLQGKALASEPTPGAMLDERTPEQRAIQTLLASWRRIVDEGALL